VGDREQRARVARDHRLGRVGLAPLDLEAPAGDLGAKAPVAEVELHARVEVPRALGIEERAQAQDVRVEAHRELARGQGQQRPPAAERHDDGLEAGAELGKLVDLRCGRRGQPALVHDAGRAEVAQALREDVGAHVRQVDAQIGEALGPQEQLADDQERPPLTHDVQRTRDSADVAVGALVGHVVTVPNRMIAMQDLLIGFSNSVVSLRA
jgi:hypothetical protein